MIMWNVIFKKDFSFHWLGFFNESGNKYIKKFSFKSCYFKIFYNILFLVLIITLPIHVKAISKSKPIISTGSISYDQGVYIDFESVDSFKWGVDFGDDYMLYDTHYNGAPPYWDYGGYPALQYPGTLLFQPDTQIVHSGQQSAKLSVANTNIDATRRLEVLHGWNPSSQYLWESAWYYFPSSIKPLDSWMTFHRLVYERMWDQSKVTYAQSFQISISAMTDGRYATNGQQIFVLGLGKGTVDNSNTGTQDIWQNLGADLYSNADSNQVVPGSWLTKKPGLQVPFDRWFKVTTLVYRNLVDFNNGYVKVWIDDQLVWDVEGTRTVGIDPSVLQAVKQVPPDPQGFLCSGFGLYTEIESKPKTIYVDNVIISNTSNILPP